MENNTSEAIEVRAEIQETGLAALGNAEAMKLSLEANRERLEVIHNFIKEIFIEGVDYGFTDERSKKKTLMKPGAEKITKFFNTTPTWRRDTDTWEMLGSPAGTICYICEIVDNATGKIVGSGRGAEKLGNKKRDANKSIKNAEKTSLVDAALYTFNLSDLFTQDMPPAKNDLEASFNELMHDVEQLRIGCESSMTAKRFVWVTSKDFLHMDKPDTIGALKALRKAIFEDGFYDLGTGDRIPE